MLRNPIEEIREQAGLGREQLAMTLGSTYTCIYRLEMGHVAKVQPEILEALGQMGYDAIQVERNYEAWRSERRDQGREKLKEALTHQ
jgi:DNA-binding XRE family transcriptional regulator